MKDKIPTIDLRMESRAVKGGSIKKPFLMVETPYITYQELGGEPIKIWTDNKWKILLYYLWRITGIKWIAKEYNKIPR